jgi:hypothetical protein
MGQCGGRIGAHEQRLGCGEISLAGIAFRPVGARRLAQFIGRGECLSDAPVRAVEIALVDQHLPQALEVLQVLVAQFEGEALGFLQPGRGCGEGADGVVDGAHAGAHVDGAAVPLGAVGQGIDGVHGLFEPARRLVVGRQIGRLVGGLDQISGGRAPLLGAEGVVGELLGQVVKRIGVQALQRPQGLAMQHAPAAGRQAVIGDPLSHGVLEGVFDRRKALQLEQESPIR